MKKKGRSIIRCQVCLQPVTKDYQFELAYFESGRDIKLHFCGSTCLKQWIDTELDKTHLETLEDI